MEWLILAVIVGLIVCWARRWLAITHLVRSRDGQSIKQLPVDGTGASNLEGDYLCTQ